uniref:Uncharacterized protein At4g30180 n=1 Tax=Anthurium amnicola TaxID=1678845 RepID=A0A1D1YY85_9ARAE
MEEIQECKNHGAWSFEPDMVMLANFSQKYVAHLLPALLKVGTIRSCRGNNDKEVEKIVRFEVDMALVLSASGFTWSHALKQKLEKKMNLRTLHDSSTSQLVSSTLPFNCEHQNALNMIFNELWTLPPIPRPLRPISSLMDVKPKLSICKAMKPKRYASTLSSKRLVARGDEEVHYSLSNLRRILPGGSEMGVHELLSEVGSYVICLEWQVSILRSLLDAR